MFIGHIPAGYLCTRKLWSVGHEEGYALPPWKPFLIAGLVGSILPDIDLSYFYLIDHRQHFHHTYWTHLPIYWVLIGLALYLLAVVSKRNRLIPYVVVVEANVVLHLCLDTIVGKIRWLYPFSLTDFYLFSVPRIHGWWVLDFFLHWTFLFEIALCIAAIYVYAPWSEATEGRMADPDVAPIGELADHSEYG